MKQHLDLLGLPVRDKVTGFEGVVTSVSFDLYGCVQAIVTNGTCTKEGQFDSHWFDTKRLDATGSTRVMGVPSFESIRGGQELPAFPEQPRP